MHIIFYVIGDELCERINLYIIMLEGGGWLDPWSLLVLLIPIGSILYILYGLPMDPHLYGSAGSIL